MKRYIVALFALLCVTASLSAANDKDDVVYVWGASYSFADSIVYFTEIQPLEGIELEKKTGFLPHRQFYSYELKDYMNFSENQPGRMSVIFFSKKRSTLEKKEKKVKENLIEEGKTVRYLGDRFRFTKP